ncbi:hypothetical protein MAM1_0661d11085 [Mucor ambiguus]|uniref:Uncharacterized protein n=1 Tax=Mucor ambiguus TaxID=91626 RepID=A0A0C9ML41_9FUNG|nr:hypothetical protein MAM1_0661d11085 [Mucor ambiguus]
MSTLEEQFLALQQQFASLQAQLQTAPTPMQSADDTAMPTPIQPGGNAAIPSVHSVETRPHYDWSPSDALMDLMELDTPIHTAKPMPDSERKNIIESYPPMAHLDYRAPATIPSAERLMNRGQKYEDSALKQLQYLLSAVFRPLDILTKEMFTAEQGNPNLERYSIMLRDVRRLLLHVCSMMTQQRNNIALRAHDPSYHLNDASEVNYTLPLDEYQQTLTQQHAAKKAIREATTPRRQRRFNHNFSNSSSTAGGSDSSFFRPGPPSEQGGFFSNNNSNSSNHNNSNNNSNNFNNNNNFRPKNNSNYNSNNRKNTNPFRQRSAQQVLSAMDKYHQQFLRYQHRTTRLLHPFSYNTNIHHSLFNRTSYSHRPGNSGSTTQISHREGLPLSGTTDSKFLQLHVRNPQEEWWSTPGIQPKTAQPILRGSSFQDGNCPGSIINDKTERLPSLDRFVRRISAHRSSPSFTAIPTAQMERSGIPVLHDRFWFVFKPFYLHQSLQTHLRTLTLSRLQDLSVLGRLVTYRQLKASSRNTGSPGGISPRGTRMAYQLQEIGATTHPTTRTSRLYIEYPGHDSNSTSQQDEGYTSFNQTGSRKTSSSVSQSHPQLDNANTGSDLCHLSGTSIHPTPLILQESDGEIRDGLGSTSPLGSGQFRGASMMVSQHPQVEWQVSTPIDTEPNHVCRRQQHGLGLLMESSSCPRVLDSGGGGTVHQLEGIEGRTPCAKDLPPAAELYSVDSNGQHDQPFLYQQARRYSLSPTLGLSNGGMDLVFEAQDHDPSTTHTRHAQQDRGLRVSPTILQESVEDSTTHISTNTSSMGSVLDRSICRQDDQTVTKVRVVDAGPGRIAYGCAVHTMDSVSQPLCQPSMEPDISYPEQDQAGTSTRSDLGGTLLAQCSLVPSGSTHGSLSPMDATTTSGAANLPVDTSPSATTELDAIRVEIIRTQLLKKELNAQAVEDLLAQKLAPNGTNLGYRKNQLRFLEWAIQNNVSFTSFTPVELVNFLADMSSRHSLQASTLKTLRAAVVHLHDNPKGIRESAVINDYIDSRMKQAPPVNIHRPTIDISPAMAFAQSIASRTTTPIKQLQQKLVFLLAMTAFLRPSDLARALSTTMAVSTSRWWPPKKLEALRDHPGLASRPSGSQLFVKSNLINQPLSSSTISSWLHREFIQLCTSESNVSVRSLASSRALDSGISRDNIVALGNWASSETFVRHYQRNQMAQVDFTSTVLSSQDEFFDANDSFGTLD